MRKKLADYLEDYYFFTGKASEVNRQLALAGIAIIWLYKNPTNTNDSLSLQNFDILCKELTRPLFLLTGSLALDLLQYISGAVIWGCFFKTKERKVTAGLVNPENVKASKILGLIIDSFFYLKIIAMILAYTLIIIFFIPRL